MKSLILAKQEFTDGDEVQISVDVTNTGDRAGKEVVQLYVSDLVASITPPVKRLRGFQKVDLDTGSSQTVTFTISADDLAFVGKQHNWITEDGDFNIQISSLEETITLKR